MFTENPNSSRAISVSELNRQARSLLEKSFLIISVEGELSNFVCPASGHWYFTLKDSKAQVRCAMFKNRSQFLKYRPRNGDRVMVRAKVSLYEGRGEFQLICDYMEESGAGQLQQAYEQLKARLHAEGLFDPQTKQALPEHPRHIGVITSPTGAAIQDVLTVLKRRFPGLPVSLYPVAVQGEDAAPSIVRAIGLANQDQRCDVLIVGRGGGSLEDLWAFNEEAVARAIYSSEIPVISAVGHEVDVVISDFVADVRAPTPSAAAELVSPDQNVLQARLNQHRQRLNMQLRQRLRQQQDRLSALRARLRHPGDQLRQQAQRLDELEQRMQRAFRQRLQQQRQRLTQLEQRLQNQPPQQKITASRRTLELLQGRMQNALQQRTQQSRLRFRAVVGRLHAVSPLATLDRGYAIVQDNDGRVVQQATQVQPGDKIRARLGEGALDCTVDQIIKENT